MQVNRQPCRSVHRQPFAPFVAFLTDFKKAEIHPEHHDLCDAHCRRPEPEEERADRPIG